MAEQPILIADYDENWSALFQLERDMIVEILEDNLVRIEHIGSTSISGLAAKAVIDMMAGVVSLDGAASKIPLLTSRGYQRIETGMSERFFLRMEAEGIAYHLHIVPCEGFEERNELLLRDYLRRHEDLRNAYADLKRSLALKMGDDHTGYTVAKTEFIQKVVDLAREEKGLPKVDVWED